MRKALSVGTWTFAVVLAFVVGIRLLAGWEAGPISWLSAAEPVPYQAVAVTPAAPRPPSNQRSSDRADPSDPFLEQRAAAERYLRTVPARFNVPQFLPYGRSTEISLVIEPEGPGSGASRLEGMSGQVVTANVQVSPQVRAVLAGPSDLVEIKPRGGEDMQRKPVILNTPVQWIWDVRGISDGIAVLQLDLVAYVPTRDRETTFQVGTFRRQIPIQISGVDRARRFVTDLNPVWGFMTAVLAGLGSFIGYFGFKPTLVRPKKQAPS